MADAEELAEQLAGMNIHDRSAQAVEVATKLGEAVNSATSLKNQVEQLNTSAAGVDNQLDEAITLAQALMGLIGGSGSERLRHRPVVSRPQASASPGLAATPLDAVPPRAREPIAKTGQPSNEPAEIADHQGNPEHESRLSRLGRVASQQAGDINSDVKKLTDDFVNAAQSFRRLPEVPTETATTAVQPSVTIDRPADTAKAGDVTSTVLTVTLGAVAYFKSRSGRKELRKGHQDDHHS